MTGRAEEPAGLRERARDWLRRDPDPQTRAELAALLEAGDDAALADRFGARLEFGTAGLRGELGAGPNRMNRATVARAAAGVAAWAGPGAGVVIGYDARHRSADFARDTAEVLAGAGCRALLLPGALPTPVLAYAVRRTGAAAGVMVTASHNPARDSGYKVYRGATGGPGPEPAGAQIVPPDDALISAAIDAAPPVDLIPRGGDWAVLPDGVVEDYIAALGGLPLGEERELRTAYTPLHGVGGAVLGRAFAAHGFAPPLTVPEQADPDPDFPTAPFPNPEEPGVMDPAMRYAERTGADLVIANDPDADRLAVGVPGRRMLTGDELGGLLAEYVLRRTSGPDRSVATTIVSAGLLPKIAAAHGVRCAEALTGFKWLVRAVRPGERQVLCYEEALGYCLGGDGGRPVLDKDGIGAALVAAALAAEAKRDGRTLLDLLDDQARSYGLHATAQSSLRTRDSGQIAGVMRGLRERPPDSFGGMAVEEAEDFAPGLRGLPPTDALRYRLSGPARGRLTLRPSGTEPKLKAYLEVVLPVAGEVEEARTRAGERLEELKGAVAELFRAG
ncbi:phospho-sugar mutase [Nocardiopsis sp. CNT-189]|uniref:phospho-sugar mutase n=1 Tax=Nocardiopsis oceanisediminis TaxID=2816862 RepID=UPI003B32659E